MAEHKVETDTNGAWGAQIRSAAGSARFAARSYLCTPRAPEAVLEIDPAFAPALHRVTAGEDLILLTWLHRADRGVLQTHPRGDATIPLTGVFATRSAQRPNPIGLHRVTITAIEGPTRLRVRALEAIDGTPILDLKAVIPESRDE